MRLTSFAVGFCVLASSSSAKELYITNNGAAATLRTLKGINSQAAVLTGETSRAQILEYCRRDPGGTTVANGGKLTIAQCVAEEMKNNRPFMATADCPARRITTTSGMSVTLKTVEGGEGVWTGNGKSIDDLDYGPDAGRIADAQFKLLCPEFFNDPASAAEFPFIGRWDTSRANCLKKAESDNRATFTRERIEFFETSCTVSDILATGKSRWRVTGACSAEGETMPGSYDLTLKAGRLVVRSLSERASRTYYRCE